MIEQAKIERVLQMMQLMSGERDYRVDELCDMLSMSKRTYYRYLDTFRDAGFMVEKKERNLFKITRIPEKCSNFDQVIWFSQEEAQLLGGLIDRLDGTNSLKSSLSKKLSAICDNTPLADYIVNRKNAVNIDELSKAIRFKQKAILHDYESGNSLTVRDRFVEPFAFTTNFVEIWAYDLESGSNKVFKISRMASVERQNEKWSEEDKHAQAEADIFRMNGELHEHIVLRMTSLAKNLLLEEFPLSEPHIRKDGEDWILDTEICQVFGAGRFVMGLLTEIDILEGPMLRAYVSSVISSFSEEQ